MTTDDSNFVTGFTYSKSSARQMADVSWTNFCRLISLAEWSACLTSLPGDRGFDFRNFHNFKTVLGLQRGPPSLVKTIR